MASVGRSILQTRLHTCFFGRATHCVVDWFPWCSGYHVRLTRGRTQVRVLPETGFLRVCILENPIAGPSEVMVGAHNSRYPGFKGLWGI